MFVANTGFGRNYKDLIGCERHHFDDMKVEMALDMNRISQDKISYSDVMIIKHVETAGRVRPSIVRSLGAASLFMGLFLNPLSYANAEESSRVGAFFSGSLGQLQGKLSACSTAINESDQEGRDCLRYGFQDYYTNQTISLGFGQAEKVGQSIISEHFQIKNRLNYRSNNDVGVQGDLDIVLPLVDREVDIAAGFDRNSEEGKEKRQKALKNANSFASGVSTQSNLFVQQGVTRWQDDQGTQRNDMRWGLVYRFNLSPVAGENILGFATFVQQNAERGHNRVVSRYDYNGKWGQSWVNYYRPTTSWVDGRDGYQERAIGGSELGHQIKLTDTVSTNIQATEWQSTDINTPNAINRTESIGINWKPHPWVSFSHEYQNTTKSEEPVLEHQFNLNIPLGRDTSRALPRWKGLGVLGNNQEANPDVIWEPVENLREIKYVERVKPVVVVKDAKIEFLAGEVKSGNEIGIKVELPNVATEDTKLFVRLEPGKANPEKGRTGVPAVPGEDYDETPIEILVAKGTSSAEGKVKILLNRDMTEQRLVKVIVEKELNE